MQIRHADKKKIYMYLFQEGVMVAKKDPFAKTHVALDVRNIYVMKAMQSLESRGYVRSQFSWQWYYYFITPEGVEFLRNWLHIPETVVPTTYKKPTRLQMDVRQRDDRGGEYRRRPMGDREDYRRRDADWNMKDRSEWGKREGPGTNFKPDFRGAGGGPGGRGPGGPGGPGTRGPGGPGGPGGRGPINPRQE